MPSDLHLFVHRRLREIFGDPDTSLGRDDHWALRPDGPYSAAINVLVNGTGDQPAVWVFDPHSKDDGVMRTSISREEDLPAVVKQIQDRVKQAGAKQPPGS